VQTRQTTTQYYASALTVADFVGATGATAPIEIGSAGAPLTAISQIPYCAFHQRKVIAQPKGTTF